MWETSTPRALPPPPPQVRRPRDPEDDEAALTTRQRKRRRYTANKRAASAQMAVDTANEPLPAQPSPAPAPPAPVHERRVSDPVPEAVPGPSKPAFVPKNVISWDPSPQPGPSSRKGKGKGKSSLGTPAQLRLRRVPEDSEPSGSVSTGTGDLAPRNLPATTSTSVPVSVRLAVQDPEHSVPSGTVSKGTGSVQSALLSISSAYGNTEIEAAEVTLAWTAGEEDPDFQPDPSALDESFPSSPGDVLGDLMACPSEVVTEMEEDVDRGEDGESMEEEPSEPPAENKSSGAPH